MLDPRFPKLTNAQIQILQSYGTVETFKKEQLVFELGEQQYNFYVVLEGEVHIVNPYEEDTRIVIHKKKEFTGDSGMLSNRGAQFNALAMAGTTLLKIESKELKKAIAKHTGISDVLMNAFLLRQETVLNEVDGGIKLIGSGDSQETYAIRDFMDKNHIWYDFLNIDHSEKALELLNNFNVSKEDLPILVNSQSLVCRKPSLKEVARHSGVLMDFEDKVFDVLIIGAGPAGLAASVYAASEGLSVVTIDSNAPGGQAGKSSKIENYLGFPTGISGSDLANKAYVQAQKFGCSISIPHKAHSLSIEEGCFKVCASNDKVIQSKTLVVATGAQYGRLPLPNIEHFEGSGVYYSATGMNASDCKDQLIGIVGGGNSAGQAALFMANHAEEVFIILRSSDLAAKMSDYLVQRIDATDNITLLADTEVVELKGNYHLESVVLEHKTSGKREKKITNLFTFIGAKPLTKWLENQVITDDKGFICTGPVLEKMDLEHEIYQHRSPQSLETSVPGLFAVGDVRNGSVKRVASAVGEGSMAVSQIHRYLAELSKLQNR